MPPSFPEASGRATLRDLHRLKTKDVARRVGMVPQGAVTPEGIRVDDLVARGPATSSGRWAHKRQRADR